MVEVHIVTSSEMLERCFAIRREVFVDEQGVPGDEEIDTLDFTESTIHVLALHDGADVGTARLLYDSPGRVHIGRVAVREQARRLGVGRALMEALQRVALQSYGDDAGVRVALSAQLRAVPFYTSLGYALVDGCTYLDAGIEHQDMELRVSRAVTGA